MKRLLTLLLSVLCLQLAYSHNDTFCSIEELLGKDIYVTKGNIYPCTYIMIDGKLKLAQKDKKHVYYVTNRSYKVDSELYRFKKDDYIVLKGGGDIYFLKVNDNPIYLSLMKSESYWKEYLMSLNDDYPYMDIKKGRSFHAASSHIFYGELSKLLGCKLSI